MRGEEYSKTRWHSIPDDEEESGSESKSEHHYLQGTSGVRHVFHRRLGTGDRRCSHLQCVKAE